MKKLIVVLLFILVNLKLSATHSLGGYISYEHVSGLTYEFTVTIWQDGNSPAIDRSEIEINWGDNSGLDSLDRTSLQTVNSNPFLLVKSTYKKQHTFPGSSFTYSITVEDPNRPFSIINITNSVNVPLVLETTLYITPFNSNQNNSATINSELYAIAEVGKEFKYNLAAVDQDGDFLTYNLVPSRGTGNSTAPGYQFPSNSSVHLINGELSWLPSSAGKYQFTIEITECRKNGFLAKTTIDLMVTSETNSSQGSSFNTSQLNKDQSGAISYTITPGDTLSFNLPYLSTNTNDSLRLIEPTGRASYTNQGAFKFISKLNDNRCAPYLFVFENNSSGIIEHETVMIRVIDTNQLNCDTLCGFGVISVKENPKATTTVHVAPNPFKDFTFLSLSTQLKENTLLQLFDSKGKEIPVNYSLTGDRIKLNRPKVNSGIYFYRIFEDSQFITSGKLLIQ